MNSQVNSTASHGVASLAENYEPIDRFDTAMDLLVTACMAINNVDLQDRETLVRVSSVLAIATDVMQPIREALLVSGGDK